MPAKLQSRPRLRSLCSGKQSKINKCKLNAQSGEQFVLISDTISTLFLLQKISIQTHCQASRLVDTICIGGLLGFREQTGGVDGYQCVQFD